LIAVKEWVEVSRFVDRRLATLANSERLTTTAPPRFLAQLFLDARDDRKDL